MLQRLNKETSCQWATIVPVQCLYPSCPGSAIVHCVCVHAVVNDTHDNKSKGLNRQKTLEDFLKAPKRIRVVSTAWIIHSLHRIMSYQPHAYLHNVSSPLQPLTQLPKLLFMQQFTAFVNEWSWSLLCKYIQIKQKYWPRKILEPFTWGPIRRSMKIPSRTKNNKTMSRNKASANTSISVLHFMLLLNCCT